MKQESGRSLIEILGVLAIVGVMSAVSIKVYNSIRNSQIRTIAVQELKQIATNTRLLLSPMGDYSFVSVDYLIKAGALKNGKAPIGSNDWSVKSNFEGTVFSINLTGLSTGECEYLSTVALDFVYKIVVNNHENADATYCLSTSENQVSLYAE